MSKTLLESLNNIVETLKGGNDELDECVCFDPEDLSVFEEDTKPLGERLGLTPMQLVMLAVIIEKSTGRRTMVKDVARFLNMGYLKFLCYMNELLALRDKWYIRIDNDDRISVPADVLHALTKNEPFKKPQTKGLTTDTILNRMKGYLFLVKKEEIADEVAYNEITTLLDDNPDTSIGQVCHKYLNKIVDVKELYMFYVIVSLIYENKVEELEMGDLMDYITEVTNWQGLNEFFKLDALELMLQNVIEHVVEDGLVSKEKFKVRDEILKEVFADVKTWNMAKSKTVRLLDCSQVAEKQLFYNPTEQEQIGRLAQLLDPQRMDEIFNSMKSKGLRTGFCCLFYGAPGTGKTETVYQLARQTGRKILEADVSQLKNCWVGETEKNARNLFKEYRTACKENDLMPILLFNEADAILGVRMEGAQRSVDKMENSLQNIFLQEMEQFSGILIATTNLTKNLDKAFERRFLYKVCFTRPSQEIRSKIWQTMIPEIKSEEALKLAGDFEFSGGQIENVVRKRAVDAILNGFEPDFETVMGYCREEMLGKEKKERRRIGFV